MAKRKLRFCQYVVSYRGRCCANKPEEASIYCEFHLEVWPQMVKDVAEELKEYKKTRHDN